jgi:hypothetical protein
MKSKKPQKPKSKPALLRSDDLCKRLVTMAALQLYGNERAQKLIYEAVRKLQLLDAEAVKAGILPAAHGQSENGK